MNPIIHTGDKEEEGVPGYYITKLVVFNAYVLIPLVSNCGLTHNAFLQICRIHGNAELRFTKLYRSTT